MSEKPWYEEDDNYSIYKAVQSLILWLHGYFPTREEAKEWLERIIKEKEENYKNP